MLYPWSIGLPPIQRWCLFPRFECAAYDTFLTEISHDGAARKHYGVTEDSQHKQTSWALVAVRESWEGSDSGRSDRNPPSGRQPSALNAVYVGSGLRFHVVRYRAFPMLLTSS